MRVGMGYDVHRLGEGRRLILGGVDIPFPMGLQGHSDADVLTHAIIDALLGAAGLGDIGRHFPESDPQYDNISSLTLLAQVRELLRRQGWRVGNIDATVVAQRPKVAPYAEAMRHRLAETLGIAPDLVGVKATTTDGLGVTGRGEGMAAYAVALLER